MGLSTLSHVLWREREALELLLFKLEEQRLLLVDGQTRWLCHAAREVETVLDQLAELELHRAMASTAAAEELGVADDVRLRALGAAAPSPWPTVIEQHLIALQRLAEEVLDMAEGNCRLLKEGLDDIRRVVSGQPRRPSTRLLVDAAGFHAALKTNERVLSPSLVDAVQG